MAGEGIDANEDGVVTGLFFGQRHAGKTEALKQFEADRARREADGLRVCVLGPLPGGRYEHVEYTEAERKEWERRDEALTSFTETMRASLYEHREKGSWCSKTEGELFARLVTVVGYCSEEETDEVRMAMFVHLANRSLMLWDKLRGDR